MQKPQEEVMSEREWRVKHLPPKYAATWAVCEGERIITEGLTKRIAKEIADAHNAALGGEWEKFTYMLDEKESWLAAERQKLHETKEAEREAYSAYQEAAKQRDAERERRENAEGAQRHMEACRSLLNVPNDEVLYQAIKELREELLSAQAAIEHANRVNKRTAIIEADLSLLREHDDAIKNQFFCSKHATNTSWNDGNCPVCAAEITKPLVEALEKLSNVVRRNVAIKRCHNDLWQALGEADVLVKAKQ